MVMEVMIVCTVMPMMTPCMAVMTLIGCSGMRTAIISKVTLEPTLYLVTTARLFWLGCLSP